MMDPTRICSTCKQPLPDRSASPSKRLRWLRESRRMSREEMAKLLGICADTLRQLEWGPTNPYWHSPRLSTVLAIQRLSDEWGDKIEPEEWELG